MTKSTKIVAALGVAAGLGIAALPAGAIFATELIPFDYSDAGLYTTKDVTVRLNVAEALSLGVEDTDCAATTDHGDASDPAWDITDDARTSANLTVKSTGFCKHKIAGGTNNKNGFKLTVKDADADLNLNRQIASGETLTNDGKIPAVAGALGGTTWVAGWNLTGGNLTNAAIAATDQIVIGTNAAKDVQVNMTYNFATKPNQEAGKYSDVITYTVAQNTTALSPSDITANTVDGYIEEGN